LDQRLNRFGPFVLASALAESPRPVAKFPRIDPAVGSTPSRNAVEPVGNGRLDTRLLGDLSDALDDRPSVAVIAR
jgi:hypothetical protein